MRLPLVVVTDVDGTLIDFDTYSHRNTAPVVDRLKDLDVPVVLCSSKTRAELERVQQELGIAWPFVVENGAALYVPRGSFPFPVPGAVLRDDYECVEFGWPHREVMNRLRSVAERTGIRIASFADMSVQEVADQCGLSLAQARLAKLRDYDEPYKLVAPDGEASAVLRRALAASGVRVLAGGRYDHAVIGGHKGLATALLRRCYTRSRGDVRVVGLGDAANDVEMLSAVDIPVVISGPDRAESAAIANKVKGARLTLAVGPAGWAETLNSILDEYAAAADDGEAEGPSPGRTGGSRS